MLKKRKVLALLLVLILTLGSIGGVYADSTETNGDYGSLEELFEFIEEELEILVEEIDDADEVIHDLKTLKEETADDLYQIEEVYEKIDEIIQNYVETLELIYEIGRDEQITLFEEAYALFLEAQTLSTTDQLKLSFEKYLDSLRILVNLKATAESYGIIIDEITNNPNGDYDGDGLFNYFELDWTNNLTDPTKVDTDENGISDADEDYDNDGLTNLEEQTYGTDPLSDDTDGDYLNDYIEIFETNTDPTNEDTDSDGVNDGKEIELGTDPTIAQTSFTITMSAENDDTVKPAVTIDLAGDQVETLTVQPTEEECLFPETMPGYLGKAYDFNVEGTFESAVISFEFDPSSLGEDSPTICYFNSETQELEELETQIEGNIASAVVSHFSTYILINRRIYEESLMWEDVWDTESEYTGVEIVFVIDDSGSMVWNDPSDKRLNVVKDLITDLPQNSKIGLVRFDKYNTEALTTTLTTDKTNVTNYLTNAYFDSSGGTDMYNGIKKGFPLFEATDTDILKMMVVLSDGDTNDTNMHSSVISTANSESIKVYTVGLGSSTSYFNNYLKPLANNTGGEFYLASDASDLSKIFDDISKQIDLETDGDEDGIPDYYEDHMITFSGYQLPLDKTKKDTDGDGLADGEEVSVELKYNEDKTKVYVKGTLLGSNPALEDTDGDTYLDNVDLNPLIPYKTPIILLHGLDDDTRCFGVYTLINDKINNNKNYGLDTTVDGEHSYSDTTSHEIISTAGYKGKELGNFIVDSGYVANKNLYAFNYPCHDMVQYNGGRLDTYISSLISNAQAGTNTQVVDANYLFATKSDKDSGDVKFILIGHSMGGLVSRYYIENIGTTKVEKLITIDTPHYGSGWANASDAILNGIKFSPSVYDLDTKSTLFGGSKKENDFAFFWKGDETKYALNNQSPALKGNDSVETEYYSVGGYSVSRDFKSSVWIHRELDQLDTELQNTYFGFEFTRSIQNKSSYNNSINSALQELPNGSNSELDLCDNSGDDVVDYQSQFAIRFDGDETDDYQNLKRTYMIVNSTDNYNPTNSFHNGILEFSILYDKVWWFIND